MPVLAPSAGVARPDPVVLGEALDLAADAEDFAAWERQLARCGHCANPVRLRGRIDHVDKRTGEAREVYSTDIERGGVLLKACGNRRASRCPACAEVYRQDAYQLLRAGLHGGKGVPETVVTHPAVFATLTAPPFGPVHTRREQDRRALPCRPRQRADICPHGVRLDCRARHAPDDPRLGEPLCPACYDYDAAVLWNALAPELWRRTTIYIRRALARVAGLTPAALDRNVRVAYAKVAEYQRRGLIHFHAVIRLDAASSGDGAPVLPPAPAFTTAMLGRAIREAAVAVMAPVPAGVGGDSACEPVRVARWGAELDIRPISGGHQGALTAEAVAGYIAKYATKGAEGLGAALDRPIRDGAELAHLRVRPHIARHVRAAWRLGARPHLRRLGLCRWAHALGFGGHWSTKSRRYSTTFKALRRARQEYALRRRHGGAVPLDAWGRPESDEAVEVIAAWAFAGTGHRAEGERWLALAAAARAREHRRIARQERTAA